MRLEPGSAFVLPSPRSTWAGQSQRPGQGAENCLQVDRRQIVQTLGPASRVNFFFDEIFKEDTRRMPWGDDG